MAWSVCALRVHFTPPLSVSGCVRLFTAGTNPALIWAYCAADLTTALAFHGDNHQ
jgi:hypothetical protein